MAAELSILLLADDQKGHPNTIHDHIQSFRRYSRHRVELFNPRGLRRSRFLDLDAYDVVVVHYSLVVIWDDYLAPWFRERLAEYRGLKVQFLQDEYRFVDDVTAEMRRLGIDVLFSVVPEAQRAAVYGDRLPDTELLPTLTGYVPDSLVGRAVPPLATRRIDVGYRGRSLPYWLGRLGHEKIEIGRRFRELAASTALRTDIAWTESARIYGEAWNRFMTSCRAMLASESGSSIVDADGSAERAVRAYLAEHPTAPYEEVEAAVLGPFAGGPAINTLSPRLFEAAAARTAMVMFPGEYSGAVEPWTHYLPLEKDFSNFDEVVERLGDLAFLEALTARAYDDLIGSRRYSERRFVAEFDDAVAARARPRARGRHPRVRLAAEQLSAGRSYHVSAAYDLARELLLAFLGTREGLRHRALRRLALRHARRGAATAPGATHLWGDLFRLAVLASVQTGSLRPKGEPFDVVAGLDPAGGRLTITSRPADDGPLPRGPAIADDVRDALVRRDVREIVWNHAAVGQYVALHVPGLPKAVSLDVGRYDAYGVYRFDRLLEIARRDPSGVADALAPLLVSAPGGRAYRVPDTLPNEETEVPT